MSRRVWNAIFEPDDAANPVPPKPPVLNQPHAVIVPSVSIANIATGSGSIYENLKNLTDFDQTDVGKLIQSYLAPLAGVSMDEATRFKVAVQMAGHKDNLQPQAVMEAFDALLGTLNQEQINFKNSAGMFDKQIADENAKLQQLADEIAKKQSEMAALANQVNGEKAKRQDKEHEFNAAIKNRTEELNEQKAHYASLLRG